VLGTPQKGTPSLTPVLLTALAMWQRPLKTSPTGIASLADTDSRPSKPEQLPRPVATASLRSLAPRTHAHQPRPEQLPRHNMID
jgi:hypothetical protein